MQLRKSIIDDTSHILTLKFSPFIQGTSFSTNGVFYNLFSTKIIYLVL